MAFPSDQSGRTVDPVIAMFNQTRREASIVKNMAVNVPIKFAAINMSANVVIQIIDTLKSALETFVAARATTGIGQFAQDVYNDPTLNIGAEFTAMEAECVSVRDWILGQFPISASGHIQREKFSALGDGSRDTDSYPPTAPVIQGLFSRLDILAATID